MRSSFARRLAQSILFALLALAAVPARAQFLGYVANQGVSQQVFNNADCSTTLTSSYLQNIGQVGHALAYTITSGGLNVQPVIQGSADGTNFFQISNNAPAQPGIIVGVGSYSYLRVLVTGGGAGCRITANYVGSSVATTVNLTSANAQFMYQLTPLTNVPAGTSVNSANVTPPYGNAAGYLVLSYLGGAGPAGSSIAVKAIDGPTGTTNQVATFNLATTAATAQVFPITGYAASTLQLAYTAGGASASTLTVSYYFTYPGQGPASTAAQAVTINGQPIAVTVSGQPIAVTFSSTVNDPCQSSGAAKLSAAVDLPDSSTTTQLIAGVVGKVIYPCAVSIVAAPSVNDTVQFEYGTGATCTSPTALTGVYETFNSVSMVPIIQVSGTTVWNIPSGASLCAVTAGGGAQYGVKGFIGYVQQ